MVLHQSLTGLRPTWVEVDLSILESNFRAIRSLLPAEVRIIAVVKAHGYGHGVIPVSQTLEKAGVDAFAVAILEEAVVLRKAGIRSPIILLNGFWDGQEEDLIRQDLIPAVYTKRMLNILENTATRLQKPCVFHLKVNTGMSRLGVDWEESDTFLEDCSYCRWARCDGIFTHLGSAENVRSTVNQAQLNRFKDLLARINRPHRFSWCHAANSAAMINYRESWFNAVRPGLILYGIQPTEICDHNSTPISCEESWQGVLSTLRPVLSFKTRIMQIRKVRSGTAIGYGESFVTGRDSLIATLPVGYADGLLRALSNKGSVLVRGSQAPIVGRISMDLTTIDVTNIAAVQTGDDVVLIGRQSEKSIGAEDMAVQAGTIPYEIFCRIGNRVTRVYL